MWDLPMRLRKSKQKEPRQRTVVRSGETPTAFSYYTSREPRERATSEPASRRSEAPRPKATMDQITARKRLTRWMTMLLIGLLILGSTTLSGTAKVEFTGNTTNLSTEEKAQYEKDVNAIVGAGILNRFKLTINPQGIAQELKKQHPEFQNVSVVVPVLTRQLYVTASLSEPVARTQLNNQLYGIDSGGFLIGTSGVTDALPLVVDESGFVPELGKQILPQSTMSSITTITTQLAATPNPVSRILFQSTTPYELTAYLEGKGYRVKFNMKADALQQSGALIATLKHLGDIQPSEYIDVRVPGRVYYK
jgi:cell division septal protein FtsQ